jgi:hypothetical protein
MMGGMGSGRPRAVSTALAVGTAALTVALAAPAQATTYNNVANGAPRSGACNLSDAIKAATTNAQVHGCSPGSATGTDTIILQAGVLYQGWGTPLHVPPTGGRLAIQGGVDAQGNVSTIQSANYGYPNPIGGTTVCSFPAAIFSGGTLTLTGIKLQANETDTTGICQYAGSLTINGCEIGDGLGSFGFNAGGIASIPSNNSVARTLTIQSGTVSGRTFLPRIIHNYTPNGGAGIVLLGNVNTNITDATFEVNNAAESGSSILWAGGYGKMGNLTLTRVTMDNNQAGLEGGWGGAMWLDPDDANATVTINSGDIQVNAVARPEFSALYTAGAIYVGAGFGTDKLILTGQTFFQNNLVYWYDSDGVPADVQQWTFNSDPWVYNAISCRGGSTVDHVTGSEWNGHSPQLKGDGTCTLQ